MKHRNTPPRLICYLSAVALSIAGCSQNTTKVKPTAAPRAETEPTPMPSDGGASRLFHYSKKGLRQVKIKDTRSTKRVQYEYANLWERLFDNYALPDVQNLAVEREVSWFVNHPSYLQRAQQRAEPFLYNIVQQIERQGVPGELALLPVVESAFQAQAVSPAKAAGIWQFIPATGRHYGLRQNHAYDGRRDVYASTRAAIKYLKKLNRQFNGDWLLAIAAYNCGEGAVERAIQRNLYNGLPTDFWSLELPQETRSYVPRLLAVSRLMSDADRYGVDLLHIPNRAQYKPVKVSQQLDLALAADAADMSLEQFRALNPGFKNTFIDPEGSVRLFVPASKSKTFKKELARLASMQTDLLNREFQRTQESTDELTGSDTVAARMESVRSEPQSTARRRYGDEAGLTMSPPAPSTTATRSVPVEDMGKPSPSGLELAYAPPAASSDPFSSPRVIDDFESSDLAAEEPRHRRGLKTRYQVRPSRSAHGHRPTLRASEVKKNGRLAAAKLEVRGSDKTIGSGRTHKPPVSYRYSDDPGRSKSVSSPAGKATPVAAKSAAAGKKPGKPAVGGAPSSGTRVSQASIAKSRGRDAAASSSSGSNSRASSKNERIVTAKAETARVKTRR